MKKIWWIAGIGILILIILIGVLRVGFDFQGEDSWIKDSRGVWVKHGNPSSAPTYVLEQQELIRKAIELYDEKKLEIGEFNSECLGVIDNYAVDIVHVPRNSEDNLIENQCSAFRSGEVSHFIELDKEGEIVRIV